MNHRNRTPTAPENRRAVSSSPVSPRKSYSRNSRYIREDGLIDLEAIYPSASHPQFVANGTNADRIEARHHQIGMPKDDRLLPEENSKNSSRENSASPLPRDPSPSPCSLIDVGGKLYALRGRVDETEVYVRMGRIHTIQCWVCTIHLNVIDDALLAICPLCRTVNPNEPRSSNAIGVGLGFTEDWKVWQTELRKTAHVLKEPPLSDATTGVQRHSFS